MIVFNWLSHWQEYQKFKKLDPVEKRIVIFSESYQDWHHLEPLVTGLTEEYKQRICYVSSDHNDPGLQTGNPYVKAFWIPEGFLRTIFFQYLEAELLVLTMMDLNNFELKRSVHPVHYVYLFHSLTSTHMVDNSNSFDHYDSLLCAGPHQAKEIRAREQIYDLKKKNLIPYGSNRLEVLMENAAQSPQNEEAHILLAPTWGDQSILNTIGSKLCKAILDQGHTLTVRPHYETVKRTPGVLQGLQANFSDHPKFNLILSMSENESLFRSQLLITDWSGISFEYSLGLGKPVIFIDLPPRVRNPKWQELGIEPFESWIRNKVGKIILPDDIDGISEKINEVISQTDQIMTEIKSIREQWVYNLGQTRNVGPKEIIKLLK